MILIADSTIREQHSEQDHKAQKQLIENALNKLPGEDALLLTLFYLAEQSVEEIGLILGLTASNVKVRLFRARQKLRNNLKI